MESFRGSLPGLARARLPASLSEGGPYFFSCMVVLRPSRVTRGQNTLIPLLQAMVAADLLGCDQQVSDWAGVLGCRRGRPRPSLPLTRWLAMWLRVRRMGLRAAPQDAWLTAAVRECKARPTRCIQTLGGRRRYLPDIAHADASRRARAERQAVNSICQARRAPHRRLPWAKTLGYKRRPGRAPHRPADVQVDWGPGWHAGWQRWVAWPSLKAKRPAHCPSRYIAMDGLVCAGVPLHVVNRPIGTVPAKRRARARAQGSAADLVKWAMVDLHSRLPSSLPSARACRMLLQARRAARFAKARRAASVAQSQRHSGCQRSSMDQFSCGCIE